MQKGIQIEKRTCLRFFFKLLFQKMYFQYTFAFLMENEGGALTPKIAKNQI